MEKRRYQCIDCAHKGVTCEPYQRYSRIEEINECEDYTNKNHMDHLATRLRSLHRMPSHKTNKGD